MHAEVKRQRFIALQGTTRNAACNNSCMLQDLCLHQQLCACTFGAVWLVLCSNTSGPLGDQKLTRLVDLNSSKIGYSRPVCVCII